MHLFHATTSSYMSWPRMPLVIKGGWQGGRCPGSPREGYCTWTGLWDAVRSAYPPSFALSVTMLVWGRHAYRAARKRITTWLLQPLVDKANAAQKAAEEEQQQQQQAPQPAQGPQPLPRPLPDQPVPQRPRLPGRGNLNDRATRRQFASTTKIVIVGLGGPDDMTQVDPDSRAQPPPLGTEAVVEEPTPPAVALAAAMAGVHPPVYRSMYISPSSVLRLVWAALGSPLVATMLGAALQGVSMGMKPGNWLERLLAVSAFREGNKEGRTAKYQGVRSLHWRNTLSFGLYVVACDAASLAYRYLRLKRRAQTTVQDLPFQGGMVEGLELRED